MFNAALLRVAREAAGLTQRQLADLGGYDQADGSRWERGIREPAPAQVQRLGQALDVSPVLFNQPIPVTEPVHRSARIESKKIQREVNGRLELSRIAMERILSDVDVEAPFTFPTIEDPAPSSDPEAAATAVRRVWRIPDGPLENLAKYLEAAGAMVLKVDFGVDAIIAAYTQLAGNARWFFLNVRCGDPARVRFSLAHELGHAVLHWDRFDAPVGPDAEREAHRFAAALLLPAREMSRELAGSQLAIAELIQIGERWGVSPQALIMRAEDLGIISRHQKSRYFQKLNARGLMRAQLVTVDPEEPALVSQALAMQRDENAYSDEAIAEIAGLPLTRLADLLPDYFDSDKPRGARLKLVSSDPAST